LPQGKVAVRSFGGVCALCAGRRRTSASRRALTALLVVLLFAAALAATARAQESGTVTDGTQALDPPPSDATPTTDSVDPGPAPSTDPVDPGAAPSTDPVDPGPTAPDPTRGPDRSIRVRCRRAPDPNRSPTTDPGPPAPTESGIASVRKTMRRSRGTARRRSTASQVGRVPGRPSASTAGRSTVDGPKSQAPTSTSASCTSSRVGAASTSRLTTTATRATTRLIVSAPNPRQERCCSQARATLTQSAWSSRTSRTVRASHGVKLGASSSPSPSTRSSLTGRPLGPDVNALLDAHGRLPATTA
jgi:hypothetical protein